MDRVSTNLVNDNMQWYTRQREVDMNDMQSRIAGQNRILNLRDDPAAASHSTRYESFIGRLETYSTNIQATNEQLKTTDTLEQQALAIMQEARQIAVQSANGTYTPSDLKAMGTQIDQYLQQLVQISNSVDGTGESLFAGFRTKTTPFRVIEGSIPGSDDTHITGVEYLGDIGKKVTEIADNQYVETSFPGNQVFWAENQKVYARRDASAYTVPAASQISIDGVGIDVAAGDNVYSIINKINSSKAAVKARLDPVQNSLVLETTVPHQLWVEDSSGKVLQDLGITRANGDRAPNNLGRDTQVFGGSAFDMLISLRDNLYSGNQKEIGGRVLAGLDSARDNLLSNLASLGAKSARLDLAYATAQKLLPDYNARLSLETDVDITKAITDYKTIELTHQAALATSSKILQPTLLDFLR